MKIKFHKKFYSSLAIKNSIRAYKNLAQFKIVKSDKYYLVSLTKIDPDVKNIIKDEFCNYVLSQTR